MTLLSVSVLNGMRDNKEFLNGPGWQVEPDLSFKAPLVHVKPADLLETAIKGARGGGPMPAPAMPKAENFQTLACDFANVLAKAGYQNEAAGIHRALGYMDKPNAGTSNIVFVSLIMDACREARDAITEAGVTGGLELMASDHRAAHEAMHRLGGFLRDQLSLPKP